MAGTIFTSLYIIVMKHLRHWILDGKIYYVQYSDIQNGIRGHPRDISLQLLL